VVYSVDIERNTVSRKAKERKMTVSSKIRKALKGIMSEGEANACYVGKGYHYDGSIESNGWHYIPFNGTAVHLGENADESLETLEQINEETEAIRKDFEKSGW